MHTYNWRSVRASETNTILPESELFVSIRRNIYLSPPLPLLCCGLCLWVREYFPGRRLVDWIQKFGSPRMYTSPVPVVEESRVVMTSVYNEGPSFFGHSDSTRVGDGANSEE